MPPGESAAASGPLYGAGGYRGLVHLFREPLCGHMHTLAENNPRTVSQLRYALDRICPASEFCSSDSRDLRFLFDRLLMAAASCCASALEPVPFAPAPIRAQHHQSRLHLRWLLFPSTLITAIFRTQIIQREVESPAPCSFGCCLVPCSPEPNH